MIGIFGGTFDPVHYGHLKPVAEVRNVLSLDSVRFMPCATPPHREPPVATSKQRLTMLELALAGYKAFQVDDREIRRGGRSYTVMTLQSLRAEFGDRPLGLIMGMDAFLGFRTWHRWQEIPELAHIIVMQRPGWSVDEAGKGFPAWAQPRLTHEPAQLTRLPYGLVVMQPVTPVDVSGTRIRKAIAKGDDVHAMLPEPVLAFIREQGLYGYRRRESQVGTEPGKR